MKTKNSGDILFEDLLKSLEMPAPYGNALDTLSFFASELNLNGLKIQDNHGPSEAVRSGWDDSFSDPRNHDPSTFRYLVHGLQGTVSRIVQRMALIELPGEFDPSQDIDLSQTPGRIREKKVVSTSIVDQDHTQTFGDGGLILATPQENILDVSHEDLGTNFANPDKVLGSASRNIPPLDLVLSLTGNGRTQWNETRLTGSTSAGDVTVVGYWIKVDERGVALNHEIAERMQSLSLSQSLPLVTFVVESQPMLDQLAEIHTLPRAGGREHAFAVSLNEGGLRFFVNLDEENATVINRYREIRPMTRCEGTELMQKLEEQLDEVAFAQIAERLEVAVTKCKD
ncbi:MAG: hypothetical protein KDD62_12275 [Bdellovibrionales bacterium]|nr:hypothetical protein [Bdellovibrionales bacterium]